MVEWSGASGTVPPGSSVKERH